MPSLAVALRTPPGASRERLIAQGARPSLRLPHGHDPTGRKNTAYSSNLTRPPHSNPAAGVVVRAPAVRGRTFRPVPPLRLSMEFSHGTGRSMSEATPTSPFRRSVCAPWRYGSQVSSRPSAPPGHLRLSIGCNVGLATDELLHTPAMTAGSPAARVLRNAARHERRWRRARPISRPTGALIGPAIRIGSPGAGRPGRGEPQPYRYG